MNKGKTALIFGGLTSLVMIVSWFVTMPFMFDESGNMDMGLAEIGGFVAMFISMLVILIGIKNYRDKTKSGFITFREAFVSGLYIVLVASVIYTVGWMIYYPTFMPDFADQYTEYQIQTLEEKGLSSEQLEQEVTALKEQMKLYDNPVIIAGMTFLEFFPLGLVFAAIWALVLRRRNKG